MNKFTNSKVRFQALDALRGIAILMMILSGTIPFDGALPGWMYHAQLPPPGHFFQPDLPGITWFDLVFPFFLFSMGAAIPFSLGGKIDREIGRWELGKGLFMRFSGLALFAIVSQHARPWVIGLDSRFQWVIALVAMIGMILVFAAPASGWWKEKRKYMVACGVIILAGLFWGLHLYGILKFNLQRFDIIIMVLANTALAGGLVYILYRRFNNTLWIAFVLMTAFFLSGRDGNNWIADIYKYSPLSWLVSWNYLKYMIVIIPGIYAGGIIRKALMSDRFLHQSSQKSKYPLIILLASIVILVVSVIGLYERLMLWSFIVVLCFSVLLVIGIRKWDHPWKDVLETLLPLTIVLIISGYLTEPLHGGIKKDSATLSYMLLTAGLALITLFIFIILIDVFDSKRGLFLFTGAGKNAMMAYVAGSNLIHPLMNLSGISHLFSLGSCLITMQVLKAITITILVAWVSALAAKRGLFMKV